jgi:hypothetical protein
MYYIKRVNISKTTQLDELVRAAQGPPTALVVFPH